MNAKSSLKSSAQNAVRLPVAVDLHVGVRIRMRRRFLGVSQQALAAKLGITFQQVQKYERGANRVSASKLYEIASALNTPISFFFEGLSDPLSDTSEPSEAKALEHSIRDFLHTAEGMELAEVFSRLDRQPLRRQVLELVRALG